MPGRRASKRSAAAAATAKLKEEEDDVKVEEEEVVKKPKRGAAAAKKGAKGGRKKATKVKVEVKDEVKDENGDEGEEEEAESKMKSVVVKGRAPVDEHCPVREACHVYHEEEGDVVWDCMLNQTNIQNNNNKFYLIQLLEKDCGGKYHVWMRWGRVGYKGQTGLTSYHTDLDAAKSVFESKFHDKTKNLWSERDSFEKVAGKYDLVKMDYSADDAEELASKNKKDKKAAAAGDVKKEPEPVPDSQLSPEVQDLISTICDVKTMEQTMVEMQYDTKKAPLGKVTTGQLRAGYEALKRISDIISEPNKSSGSSSGRSSSSSSSSNHGSLLQACNDFYTRIPHEFGMRVPPLIRTMKEVKKKIELLEALGDIQVALKILNEENDEEEGKINPVDRQYKQLEVKLVNLEPASKDFKLINKYITSTHGHTHSQYELKVEQIFECEKESESGRFRADVGNRMLLFHGSRMSNWAGILGQGLRIAPPEAPPTGYMFGKGVYFADMSSKSANYCWPTPSKNVGLLMLCEVALGDACDLVDADCMADDRVRREGKDSVKGLGTNAPDVVANGVKLADGTVVPMGPSVTTDVRGTGFTLAYNEYIVYDVAQIRMRYLARIRFNFKNRF